ncbi:MT-A70 family methyltransferase [uncultured Devosia sp.]|uniref:MT-A70 family methyltransferase n=1 Tax=uncultured Devosia sp. TaxID=211434 RepID=UPI0026046A8B|nr:MT-A70 family methyltransferase [uncultured Devosia sp.]
MIGQTDVSTVSSALAQANRYKPALSYHPLANLFPMIEGPERVAFRQSIRDNGLRHPIVMHEGMILDGRNRYRELLGLQLIDHSVEWQASPYFRRFGSLESDGEDPLSFVLDLNLDRRHLNESQRASVAARMATMKRGERTDLKEGTSLGGGLEKTSRAEAAERLNVSERSVNSAKAVQDKGAPELVDAVDQGVLPVSVAEKLLALPAEEQARLVKEETPAVIRNAAKKAQRNEKEAKLAAKQKALPDKRYNVIYEDPAWRFEPRSRETGLDRAADNHYPTMSLEELRKLPVADIAAADCALFMWATVPFLAEALDLIARRGFVYKSHYIWDKTPWDGDAAEENKISGRQGNGFWSRVNHEILLIATRGNPPCPAPGDNLPSVYREVAGEHSAKPEYFARMIEGYFPNLPKIELNARAPRDGWDVWGNESEGKEARPEKPAKVKAAKKSRWEVEREARDARLVELMKPMSDDLDELKRAYGAAIDEHHKAFMAKDEEGVGQARDLMEAILLKANGGAHFGSSVNERPVAVKAAGVAPSGAVPLWGQVGHFIAVAEGVRAIVTVGDGNSIHAVDLDKPFPSETGFISISAQAELGMSMEEYGAACIRAAIVCCNRKDSSNRAAQRGLMMPMRAYRLDPDGERAIAPVERGVVLPQNWAIGEITAEQLRDDHDAWLAELRQFDIKKRKWPESRHFYTPIFAFRYKDGVPVAAEPVNDFPAEGGYVFRGHNGAATAWMYVAGGEAERGILPINRDVQEDPRPGWPDTMADPDKTYVTPAELLEFKVLKAIAGGKQISGPVVDNALKVGDLYRDNGRIDLTQRGWSTAELLQDVISRATHDGLVNVVTPDTKPGVSSVHTEEKSVSSDYIAELEKVSHLKGKLHQSTAEPVMRAAYAAKVPLAQLEADLGHPKGTIKTWANRLKLTSIARMHEAQRRYGAEAAE